MDKVESLIIGIPLLLLVGATIIIYELVYVPAKIKADAFDKEYPTKCIFGRNQTYLLLNANDRIDFRSPEIVCHVSLRSYMDDNGTWQYVIAYTYEAISKYNKPYSETYLNCTPKTFDNLTGNWICMNGSIAKEIPND